MNRNVFERIEKKLKPDKALIDEVLAKAEKISKTKGAAPGMTFEHKESPTITTASAQRSVTASVKNQLGLVLSSAAALALIVAMTVFFGANKDIHSGENAPRVSAVVSDNELSDNAHDMFTTDDEQVQNSFADNTDENDQQWTERPDIQHNEYDEWLPDTEYDEDGNAFSKAIALGSPTDEYASFELNGKLYHFACGNYGEIYSMLDEGYISRNNIPNSSYIGEKMATVKISSQYTDIRPNASAEIYSLKYTDPDYLAAVRFIDQNDDPRYYLYAVTERSYDSFAELLHALNIEKCAFDGQAINRRSGEYAFIDDESVLVQKILSLDGERADNAHGEMAWETILDTPLYGGSLSFKWYTEGYVIVNAFGAEKTYAIGKETVEEIAQYINNNGHN